VCDEVKLILADALQQEGADVYRIHQARKPHTRFPDGLGRAKNIASRYRAGVKRNDDSPWTISSMLIKMRRKAKEKLAQRKKASKTRVKSRS
jgi:hypothetical protein